MQIQILSTQVNQATTKTGKPYDIVEVAYKNLSFQGKVEGRKIMPFGATAATHAALKNATTGQVYEVTVVKGESGYNDWTAVSLSTGETTPSAAPAGLSTPKAQVGQTRSTYETPEERAQRQILIVRQSSVSAAVATLSVGAKAVKPADVIAVAKEYEAYVFGLGESKGPSSDFEDLPNFDVPDVS